jgi:hypothetical protein
MVQSIDSKMASVKDIRYLRRAADTLEDTADQRRAALIQQLGPKRYIFNSLGQAAHLPASGSRLVWSDGVELIDGIREKLGEYLYSKYRVDRSLPQAVLVGDDKFYL